MLCHINRLALRNSRVQTLRRSYASSSNLLNSVTKRYPLGKETNGFTIDNVLPVPEFNLVAVDLTHQRTGAKHLHIDRQDKNNVFSIIFKTNPPNSTGLPHILEHTTLCGSEKYPVRDPFFKMLNRSLSNFMNAMTGHDYTFYPFSTTNKVDFNNLMDVYLDATLNPLLKAEDFYQEGWRLENEVTKDKTSPLTFKGVVYNEMKGQMSDSSYYFWIKFQESIYPSLNNSGGDPSKMTQLQYEDLVDFQSSFYHPSNARTFTYGDIPLSNHLKKIDKEFIRFGKRSKKNTVKLPIELNEKKSFVADGPVDPMLPSDRQVKSSLTWFASEPINTYESVILKILSTLLIDGHSSPLYQGLIESGLGTDYSINTGLESMTAVNLFTVGLSGLTNENADKLPEIILAELEKAKVSFTENKVKAIIHQLELSRKVESSSFGLNILSSLVPGWVNNVNPLDSLKWNEVMTRFQCEYKEKGNQLFIDLIDKYLLNKPYVHYAMIPKDDLAERITQEEQTRLQEKTKDLTDEDKETIYKRGLNLLEIQTAKEDLSCLPTLSVSDISRDDTYYKVHNSLRNGVEFQTRVSAKTNGLTYFRAQKAIKSDELPLELVEWLPLFAECITNLGTKTKTMAQLEDEIKLYSGGVGASSFVHSSIGDPSSAYLKFGFNGLSLDKNFDKLLSIFQQILIETDFNNIPKLTTLVKSLTNDNLSSIVSSGHSFARSYAASKLTGYAKLDESINGIEQIKFLNYLAAMESQNSLSQEVVPKLEKIRDILLSGSGFKYGLTCSRDVVKQQEELVSKFANNALSLGTYESNTYDIQTATKSNLKSFIEIPSQVSFSASALNGSDYTSTDSAALQILSQLLTFKYLHSEIREKGGAYGGGATYDALNGLFSFYSYRDPKAVQSIKTFDESVSKIVERIKDGSLTSEEDLEQAKLTIFQKFDSPISVKDEGMSLFKFDIEDDQRQQRRENLLDCTLDDVLEVSEKYFGKNATRSKVIIGNSTDGLEEDWEVSKLS